MKQTNEELGHHFLVFVANVSDLRRILITALLLESKIAEDVIHSKAEQPLSNICLRRTNLPL